MKLTNLPNDKYWTTKLNKKMKNTRNMILVMYYTSYSLQLSNSLWPSWTKEKPGSGFLKMKHFFSCLVLGGVYRLEDVFLRC